MSGACTLVTLISVLLVGLAIARDLQPPDEWVDRAAAGQLLFNTSRPGDGLFPNIGNGFLSGDAGCSSTSDQCKSSSAQGSCGVVHIGGVFTNRTDNRGTVPHRADIPNPFSLTVESVGRVGSALDLERGVYLNRSVVSCEAGDEVIVETALYAHRAYRSLLVFSVRAIGLESSQQCTIKFHNCSLPWDGKHDFVITPDGAQPPTPLTLTIKHMEEPPPGSAVPRVPTIVVGAAVEPPNVTVTLRGGGARATYLAVFRTTLEPDLNASQVAPTARADLTTFKSKGFDSLFASHVSAWGDVWEGGIEVQGNASVARTVNSSLYYILSAVRDDWPYGLAPGGLARDAYEGHSFWDTETWMFPNTVALFPAVARSLVEYRHVRLQAALERAAAAGLSGAMQPWESALLGFGVSHTPQNDASEIHVTGDVAMAVRLYGRMARNSTFLDSVWGLVEGAAAFFASRAVRVDAAPDNYTLLHVVPPDERAHVVNSSVYTNAIAAETLRYAATRATQPSNYTRLADAMWLPVSTMVDGTRAHPEYDGFTGAKHKYINQADVALMQYPLGLKFDDELARNDLTFYQAISSGPQTSGFFTGDSAYSIAWLQLGNRTAADMQFDLAFEHMDLTGFNVWKEKSFNDGGHLNFITGAGGFLQNFIYGYAGVRYTDEGITMRPLLPPHGISSLTLRGLALASSRLTLKYTAERLEATLTRGAPLEIIDCGGKRRELEPTVRISVDIIDGCELRVEPKT